MVLTLAEYTNVDTRAVSKMIVLLMRLVEVLFFVGLLGCVSVIVLSWISILGSGFKRGAD